MININKNTMNCFQTPEDSRRKVPLLKPASGACSKTQGADCILSYRYHHVQYQPSSFALQILPAESHSPKDKPACLQRFPGRDSFPSFHSCRKKLPCHHNSSGAEEFLRICGGGQKSARAEDNTVQQKSTGRRHLREPVPEEHLRSNRIHPADLLSDYQTAQPG